MVIVFIPLILNIGNYQLFIGILQVLFCIISSVYVRNKRIRTSIAHIGFTVYDLIIAVLSAGLLVWACL